ncbi:hypothetical protein O1Q96_19820 [Streptomyces sp. Qhu-G9]|uniref:hypothetical protein n=1 Tax=Streptomyces sp. Qhu-G9 TaxID=3452799 RepID=UPI0022AC2673|nr:hypothetical protein [Streptomyces aurantiacus]WAU81833.1 hypothetical protein O1Q96_19820 [Streptomyces aurantiacus]
MAENQTSTTELTSQYIAQVTSDLERNTKEQDRIAGDISTLKEQLLALQHDHTVLVHMQEALGGPRSAEATPASPSVPNQASAPTKQTRQAKPKKAAATGVKKAADKKTTAKKPAAKAPKSAAQPSLVDLIRGHLEKQSEPRSAAEITTVLSEAHPDRNIKTTVVRTTLENLVARSSAHRNKQGSSVFYTATTEPAAAPQSAATTD